MKSEEDRKKRKKEYLRAWRARNPQKVAEYAKRYYTRSYGDFLHRRWRRKIKLQCIARYSNGTNACACCGENHLEFLCIDHIHGIGRYERRERGHQDIYKWLRARGFPAEGYRVLCHNCNMSLGFFGYCPHGNVADRPKAKFHRNLDSWEITKANKLDRGK